MVDLITTQEERAMTKNELILHLEEYGIAAPDTASVVALRKALVAAQRAEKKRTQYHNSNGRLWYGESMFCESTAPYRGTCANCGDSTDGFYCASCK
jgi:hypothetical protein